MQTDRKVKSQVFKTGNKSTSLALLSLLSLKKFHQEHPGFPMLAHFTTGLNSPKHIVSE